MWTDRFVRLGRYWRIRPLVFSFVPRCQGLAVRAKVDAVVAVRCEIVVSCHLGALVPGEAPAGVFRQVTERGDERVAEVPG